MNLKPLLIVLAVSLVMTACQKKNESVVTVGNPPAEGFDLADSDPAAIQLADSVMSAMGGRANWDNTRFISWIGGKRNLVWDKQTGRVRIEAPENNTIYLLNVSTLEGRVQENGQELTQSDSVKKRLAQAKSIWSNDSYWLVMPFKLKDVGVTLKYLGEDTLNNGALSNILEMTLKNAGDTTKYNVYVDLTDNLIKQWAHFKDAHQDTADIIRPFNNYKKYGNILLSADRSDGEGPKSVKVDSELPDKVFTDF